MSKPSPSKSDAPRLPSSSTFSQLLLLRSPPVTSRLVFLEVASLVFFSGIILQSLGIGFELFEKSSRVGGRIDTWYSENYNPNSIDDAGLYGEVGGMRVPQFSQDMLPVQQLSLAINAVLERHGLKSEQVIWRKFYYNSPWQRLRFNNMPKPITAENAGLNSLNFGQNEGGDVPDVWITPKEYQGEKYLPINIVLDKVNKPFLDAINKSFSAGFTLMEQYDQYSMWAYLTTVFTLGSLEEYYDPEMGAKSDFLPWSVASYLETTNVGTGMYSVSFVEMVIAVYDWGGSKDPYRPEDDNIYMVTVDKGMQRFPDACLSVLNLEKGVLQSDGQLAQVQVGMLPGEDGSYSYTAPNLTPDARPPHPGQARKGQTRSLTSHNKTKAKQRVFLNHEAVEMQHDPSLFNNHGGMRLKVKDNASGHLIDRTYPYMISTLPSGDYLNGEYPSNLLNNLSFSKAQAIREINYMSAFKAFLTFKTQFWEILDHRQEGVGAASTDRPNRQIVYPSYGYDAKPGVLQVYCWDQDARRLGALDDEERINECLKGIAYLYPEIDVGAEFAGYNDGVTTKTWFWDSHAGGGAFALFKPGQFKNLYPTLLTPEFNGCLQFAGEACSVHHGWIVGALDSAYNAVYHVLQQAGATDKIEEMKKTWGVFGPPDIAADSSTANILDYAYLYNEVDRRADSVAPGNKTSIYGDSSFEFTGQVPAFVADYSSVPQSMKKTATDDKVLAMLNNQWDENVALRAAVQSEKKNQHAADRKKETAVELLESIYYGDNFQTIPAPAFWLKDDDEFARQQLAGFMPGLLEKVSGTSLESLLDSAAPPNLCALPTERVSYVANYRQYLSVCTVTPVDYYLAKPIVFFEVNSSNELMPLAIQLEQGGELFFPEMLNAENAWLLAKMQTNCAGQTLHDVGFHQLFTHQIGALVSIALFSEDIFAPVGGSGPAFQQHPVFKLLRPHVVKTAEFQQTIYDVDYDPYYKPFPATREVNGDIGVYNLGFVYDLIFSCGRIGNYQLQDKMYNDEYYFLNQAILKDAARRGVADTPFSYPYVHDASLWYEAQKEFVNDFVETVYPDGDVQIAQDAQLQRFFDKLIPAFNHSNTGCPAKRFPAKVKTAELLKEVLTMFIWQFSVNHTVVNDGAYNQAAFVPNASTLMLPLPAGKPSSEWTPRDVLNCMPSQTNTYEQLGNMTFMDVQINASVTGQGPYPETVFGRGVLQPSIDVLQDSYQFDNSALRDVVNTYFQNVRNLHEKIVQRQARDTARYLELHPESVNVPETVTFDLIEPSRVMNTIQT